jgi:DNA replication protein DnaC
VGGSFNLVFKPKWESNEKCPKCGRKIWYGQILGAKPFPLMCECEAEKEEREYERGGEIWKNDMLSRSGVGGRFRDTSLGTMKVLKGQESAFCAAVEFVKNYTAGKKPKGLLIVGGVGSGKTHLAAAIIHDVIMSMPVSREDQIRGLHGITTGTPDAMFYSTVELYNDMRHEQSKYADDAVDVINAVKQRPLIVLDDLGAEKPSDWTRERLYEIIDYRYRNELPTIITSNLHGERLREFISDRIYDRLKDDCELVALQGESQRG